MNHTTNYNLPQWEDTDAVKREDVNGALAAVDAALGTKPDMIIGNYYGNGTYPRIIDLGFRPKAVILMDYRGMTNSGGSIYGGLFGVSRSLGNAASVHASGFKLEGDCVNLSGGSYYYVAFR